MNPSTHIEATPLFQSIQVGNITLNHRVVMAPISRFRTDDHHVILPQVVEYYCQRASVPGTLIITEASVIAPQAGGYRIPEPGIWGRNHIAAWKKASKYPSRGYQAFTSPKFPAKNASVVDAVHSKWSYIFLQLWALGRAAYPEHLAKEGGFPYVSASAISLSDQPPTDPAPRELTIEEIKQYVQWYRQAAENAIQAGFDGVEIHGGNGYLIDQFLQDVCNKRTDEYGGPIENRTRFALEVVDGVVKSNPDLPYRLKKGLPTIKGDRSRYYTGKEEDPKGYTDYPFSPSFIESTGGDRGRVYCISCPSLTTYQPKHNEDRFDP